MTSYEGEFAAVFSPSLAKRQLLQAKDWDYVDQWLAKLYHPKPVPPFERNSDTLKILLSFATESDNAEELDALSWKYKEFAVTSLQSKELEHLSSPNAVIADELSPRFASLLDNLADISTKLDVVGADIEKLAKSLVSLSIHNAELERHVLSFSHLNERIAAGARPLEELRNACDGSQFDPPPNLLSQLTEWTRTVKLLQQKSYEYKDRAAALENACLKRFDFKTLGISSFVSLEEEIIELREKIISLEGQLRAYSGLPTDTDLAILTVEEKLQELQELIAKREELYQKNL